MTSIPPLTSLDPKRFETPAILKRLAAASRRLAELKGAAGSIPRQSILIHTLSIQEAKDSSEIENIVTTHDELFQDDLSPGSPLSPATKEVLRYRQALGAGFEAVRASGLLTARHIVEIQGVLEENQAGFRKVPGTVLKDGSGGVVYTPPQDAEEILDLMTNLERFINDDRLFDADPLIKMALIHHQFESIHPFYDGNGRTGRIINVLYLVKFYSQDLINNLFTHPYTKIDFVERDLKVSRLTATRYLEALATAGFVRKQRIGRYNYFINPALTAILTGR